MEWGKSQDGKKSCIICKAAVFSSSYKMREQTRLMKQAIIKWRERELERKRFVWFG